MQIDEDELKAIQVESTHTIDIDGFAPRAEIDKRYLDRPYYIAPNGKTGAEAFVVIRDAMQDEKRVALARIVMAHREHMIMLEPLGKGLLGTTLRYDYEVRSEKDYFAHLPSPRISKGPCYQSPRARGKSQQRDQPHGRAARECAGRCKTWARVRVAPHPKQA